MKTKMFKEAGIAQVTWLVLAVVCSFFNAYIFTKLFFKSAHFSDIVLGWLLALAFSFFGLFIKLSAVQQEVRKFFFCAFIAAPLNTFVFLGIVFYCLTYCGVSQRPFIVSIFISYGTLLVYNIALLHRITTLQRNPGLTNA